MSSTASNGVAAAKQANGDSEKHQFGWAISDKIAPEVNKQESVGLVWRSLEASVRRELTPVVLVCSVWSVFSPLAGHVPQDSLNLGQVRPRVGQQCRCD